MKIIKRIENKLATNEVEGHAGAGVVQVEMTGFEIKDLTIKQAILAQKDEILLSDLITTAVNKALEKQIDYAKQQFLNPTAFLDVLK